MVTWCHKGNRAEGHSCRPSALQGGRVAPWGYPGLSRLAVHLASGASTASAGRLTQGRDPVRDDIGHFGVLSHQRLDVLCPTLKPSPLLGSVRSVIVDASHAAFVTTYVVHHALDDVRRDADLSHTGHHRAA